jgi:hypothetical protein
VKYRLHRAPRDGRNYRSGLGIALRAFSGSVHCDIGGVVMALARRLVVLLAMAAIAAVGLTVPASAGGGHEGSGRPVVFPPNSRPYGASYAEWNARWWQWLYGTDRLSSPVFADNPGTPSEPEAVDCSAGQRGSVWFLGGTFLPTSTTAPDVFRSDVYRTCRIPPGVALFFPVLNTEFDNLQCSLVPADNSAADLIRAANYPMDRVIPGSMAVVVDGVGVGGLRNAHTDYRSMSPWFSYRLPANNVGHLEQFCGVDFPEGTSPPDVQGHPGAIADGIYLMLAPLPRGTHTLHVQGRFVVTQSPDLPPLIFPVDFTQNINYTITVG